MSDKSISEQRLKQMQAKLDASISSRASLEEDFKKQSGMLTQFIGKLSNVCKGIDLELDNRLGKLRVLLTKSAPITDIESELKLISTLLQQHATKNNANIRHMHEEFHQAGASLQKINGLPPQTRRTLRSLLTENSDTKDALIQYIPNLTQLLSLYCEVLVAKTQQADIPAGGLLNTYRSENSKPELNASNQDVIEEILEILDNIALSQKQTTKLEQIKASINTETDSDALLANLIEIFNIIIADMDEERAVARSFLSSLSGALGTVKSAVKTSIANSSAHHEKSKALNGKLNQQIDEMTGIVEKACTLAEEKAEVNAKLIEITRTIEAKSSFELEQHAKLSEQLAAMQSKVNTLEKQSVAFEKQLHEQKKKSLQDSLTKLNNRAAFDDYFAKEIVRFHHKPFNFGLVVLDLDDFKRINDTYGHTAGDKTLQVIANTMAKHFGDNGFIARYGGEEFVLLFKDLDKENLIKHMDLLRKKIVKLPFKFRNTKVNISASIGATLINSDDNVHMAFERADKALYQAKEQGKNRIIFL